MKSIFCFLIASLIAVSSFSQSVVSFNDNRDPVSTKITGFKGSKLFTNEGTFKTGNISLVVFSEKYVSEHDLYLWLRSKQIETIFNTDEYVPIGNIQHEFGTAFYEAPDRSSKRDVLEGVKEVELLRKVNGFYYVELDSKKGYIPVTELTNLDIAKRYYDSYLESQQYEFEIKQEIKQRIIDEKKQQMQNEKIRRDSLLLIPVLDSLRKLPNGENLMLARLNQKVENIPNNQWLIITDIEEYLSYVTFLHFNYGGKEYKKVEANKFHISDEQEKHISEVKKKKSELEKKKREEKIKKQNAENRARKEKFKSSLIQLYGSYDAQRILNHQYWLGMTTNMAKSSLGTPDDINRTVNTFGIREQWVYRTKDVYLYFKDGVLESFQD
jgi:hypothetical protein